ncbi:glycoside hydrolase family 36 protein [Geodermatophilus sp. SYSU D00691]
MTGEEIARVAVDRERALVYEHGWQSWSPTTAYRLDQRPYRPVSDDRRIGNYHPERTAPHDAFWGEGLLAVDPGTGEGVHVVATSRTDGDIPSVRAEVVGDEVVVTGGAELVHTVDDGGGGLDAALARWGDGFAAAAGVGPLAPPPTAWCSWYHYFERVTQDDVEENLVAIGELGLEVDVVQIDDGYQAEIGDWLTLSERFDSLDDIVGRIRAAGRRAGIWVAPFLVGERSALAREHPDWLVGDVVAGRGWGAQELRSLDTTHPGAEAYLREVFGTLRATGIDYFKIDFVYAGAREGRRADPSVSGVDAYRHGLRVVREAIGPESYLLGCGAPILPSVGLVDAMRVGPDIAHHYEPLDGDLSQPSQRAAAQNSRWRAWQQGRFWVNDTDCLVAGPHVERREDWAPVVEACSGLRSSSDRLRGLDEWGLEVTRRLLQRGLVDPLVP